MVANRHRAEARKAAFQPRPLAFAIALAFASQRAYALDPGALPSGGVVQGGSAVATISQSAAHMDVNQSAQSAIINWNTFNIGSSAQVNFHQPSVSSVALNRVNAGGGASEIFGQLNATGLVFLVNPAGVMFSPTAKVDVGGLVASTLNISDEDFRAGNYTFTAGGAGAGGIVNQGTINAPGGTVALIGPQVRNEGTISANGGAVAIGAGDRVRMELGGNKLVSFEVDQGAAAAAIHNAGVISANGGRALLTAKAADSLATAVVNNTGIVEAQTVQNVNGVIRLSGDTVTNSGTLDASSAQGNGGSVTLQATTTTEVTGQGRITAESRSGGKGGTIQLLGNHVGLWDNARIDASGELGGGTILVGGDYHGGNGVQTASATVLGKDASLSADALVNGDGGKVILWSDNYTGFYGSISARGGALSGNGGFIETSSHDNLQSYGNVFIGAANGVAGTWLLDPANINITGATANITTTTNASCVGNPSTCYTANANNATLNVATLNAALTGNANVIVFTGTGGSQNGDITVSSAITATGASSLFLEAAGNIIVNNTISSSGAAALNVHLWSDFGGAAPSTTYSAGTCPGGGCSITLNNTITTTGGLVDMQSGGSITGGGNVTTTGRNAATGTAGGAITINAANGGITLGALASNGGSATTAGNASGAGGAVSLTSSGGDITITSVASNGGSSIAGGTGGAGATGGAVTFSATNGSINVGAIDSSGGSGTGTGNRAGARGGAVSLTTTTSGDIAATSTIDTSAGGSVNGSNGVSNAAATVTINSAGNVTTGGAITTSGGDSGNSGNRSGGAGGAVSITWASGAASLSTITTTGGGSNGSSTAGAGGAVSLTSTSASAPTLAAITTTGGAAAGSGTGGAGGAVTIITASALTTPAITTTGGSSASGTGGAGRNVTIETGGNALILGGDINAAGGSGGAPTAGNVILGIVGNTVGSVSQAGSITANTLTSVSSGTVDLSGATNTITRVGANTDSTGFILNDGANLLTLTGAVNTSAGNGAVTLIADRMNLSGGGSINSGAGLVTLKPNNNTVSMTVGAGATDSATNLGLTGAELGVITTSGGITIGSSTNTGGLTVVGAVTAANLNNMTAGTLTLIDGAASGAITVNGAITTTNHNNPVTLIGDNMAITAGISTGSGLVTLKPNSAGTQILLGGSDAAGKLGLTGAELNLITTSGGLTIGVGTDTGGIDVATAGALGFTGVTTAASTISLITGGAVTDSSGGSLAPANNVNLTINAGGAVVLPTTTLLGTGALNVAAGGAITQAGALTVPGTSNFSTGNFAITLATGTNDFTGAVSLTNTGANAVQMTDKNALTLGTLSVGGDLTVISTGALNVGKGTVGGNLSATSNGGAISETAGGIAVSGTSSFNAGANTITLTDAGNDFTDAVSLNNTGNNNVAVTDTNAIVLGASNVGTGTLGITAGGNITETGAITQAAAGAVTLTVTAANSDILLNTQANNLSGAVGFGGTPANIRDVGLRNTNASATVPTLSALTNLRNLTLRYDNAAVALPTATLHAGGNLSVTAGGVITQSGALTVPGTSSFTTGGFAVTLTNTGNDFSGAVSLTNTGANNVSISDKNALVLGTSSVGSGTLTVVSNADSAGNDGGISQTGALVQATGAGTASFTVNGTAGGIDLSNTGNDFTGNVVLNTSASASVVDSNALALGTSSVGTLTAQALNTTTGDLTLNGTITASGSGDSIVLVAAHDFANNTGSSALAPGAGRWLVYSTNPANPGDKRGGLIYNFKQYNATYGVTGVLGTGNGFLYTVAPVITPSLTGTVSKVYDGTTTATLAAGNYSVSGAIDGDTVTLNNPTSGTYADKNVGTSKNVSVSGIAIGSATNGAATVYGYQLSSTTANANIGVINKAALTLTAQSNTKTYDGTISAAATPTVAGLQAGDSVSGLTETYDTKNAGSGKTLSVASYTVNDGNAGNNYTVTTVDDLTGVINKAALTVTADDKSRPINTANPPFTASFSGFVPGDTPAMLGGALVFNTPAVITSPPGNYPIIASGLTSADYTISYVNGTLTVFTVPPQNQGQPDTGQTGAVISVVQQLGGSASTTPALTPTTVAETGDLNALPATGAGNTDGDQPAVEVFSPYVSAVGCGQRLPYPAKKGCTP